MSIAMDPAASMPLTEHLRDLRKRLMRCLALVALAFAGLFPFAQTLYTLISEPLRRFLPEGASMIATSVTSPFLTPFKLTAMCAVFIAMPLLLHQAWGFLAPGLYRRERRIALPLLVSSIVLFYAGMAFAFFLVFPMMFGFFASVTPEGVAMMTDISQYLDFILALFLAFGLAFGLAVGMVYGLMFGLVLGNGADWVRYGLGTALAARRGLAPHGLIRFLDWGLSVGLFRLSGYHLQFRHRDLYATLLDTESPIATVVVNAPPTEDPTH